VAGGSLHDNDEGLNEINVVPLVDIMLVLLIIFMVTTEFVQEKFDDYKPPPNVPLQLPKAATAEETPNKSLLSLAINKDGNLFLNGNKTDLDGIKAYVTDMKAKGAKLEAFVAADERLSHGDVLKVIDTIRLLGIPDVAINTQPMEIQ